MLLLLFLLSLSAGAKQPSLRSNNQQPFVPNKKHLIDPFNLPPELQRLNKYDAHQVRLESIGYFFKAYTAQADQTLHRARESIRRALGDDAESQAFQGRASLFEEKGSLHHYTPLVYELAGIKGEHHKQRLRTNKQKSKSSSH